MCGFEQHGANLSSEAPITVITQGGHWVIDDTNNGPFSLVLRPGHEIDVYLEVEAPPASLNGALCADTQASAAKLRGVSLCSVRWYGDASTLANADMEGASLQNSLLAHNNFTKAFLSGADFSGAILIGADFRGCTINHGVDGRSTSFRGAQLQGVTFDQCAVLDADLYRAGVSTSEGVPLLRLPSSGEKPDLEKVAKALVEAGYPLGSNPSSTEVLSWRLNNSVEPKLSPKIYRVEEKGTRLAVFNDENGKLCFYLPKKYRNALKGRIVSSELRAAFIRENYALATRASIEKFSVWWLEASEDQPFRGPTNYSSFKLGWSQSGDTIEVYGTRIVRLRDWADYPTASFQETTVPPGTLAKSIIGPAGFPYKSVLAGDLDWLGYLLLK